MLLEAGSNDICQSLVVGSGAVSAEKAVLIGALAEFFGVVLLGSTVSAAFRENFVDLMAYDGEFAYLSLGMFASLIAAAFCLFLASGAKLPVSTTHAGVGGLLGFVLFTKGASVFHLRSLLNVALSWVVSPLCGGVVSYGLFYVVHYLVLRHEDAHRRASALIPYFNGFTFFVMALFSVYKVLPNAGIQLSFGTTFVVSGLAGGLVSLATAPSASSGSGIKSHGLAGDDVERGTASVTTSPRSTRSSLEAAEASFIPLLIATAVLVSFAHGSNDIGNGVGCFLIIREIAANGRLLPDASGVPQWVLVMGGAGIGAGIVLLGHRVIATMGSRITLLTPSRGYAAQLAVSSVVLMATVMGIPVSLSHTMVGAISGLTLVPAAGSGTINRETIRRILISWLVTVPIAAVTAAVVFGVLRVLLYEPSEEQAAAIL